MRPGGWQYVEMRQGGRQYVEMRPGGWQYVEMRPGGWQYVEMRPGGWQYVVEFIIRVPPLEPGQSSALLTTCSKHLTSSVSCRCDRERGPGKVQVLARLTPNIFQDGYSPTMIEPLVDSVRSNIYGADTAEPLDFLQLQWWDTLVRGLPFSIMQECYSIKLHG
jgi:hypothetical protein